MGQAWKRVLAWARSRIAAAEGFRDLPRRDVRGLRGLRPVRGIVASLDASPVELVARARRSEDALFARRRAWGSLRGQIFRDKRRARQPRPPFPPRPLRWEPADCAVVEDSPAGVAAGLSAGMTVFGYAGTTPASKLGAARVFTDMAELPALLQPPLGAVAGAE